MQESLQVVCKHFSELTALDLYEIIRLRIEVFTVEQNCPYQDADGKDIHCWHVMIQNEKNELIAYSRLIPEGVSYEGFCSIGRVVSSPIIRRTGIGRLLMAKSLEKINELFRNTPVKISGQAYLERFYASFGFERIGEEYLEDGIPHYKMVRAN